MNYKTMREEQTTCYIVLSHPSRKRGTISIERRELLCVVGRRWDNGNKIWNNLGFCGVLAYV
jgi:hypothetical protein